MIEWRKIISFDFYHTYQNYPFFFESNIMKEQIKWRYTLQYVSKWVGLWVSNINLALKNNWNNSSSHQLLLTMNMKC